MSLFALFVTQLYSKNYNKALQRSVIRVSEMFVEHRSSGIGGFWPTAASAARPRRNFSTKRKSRKAGQDAGPSEAKTVFLLIGDVMK